jgi:hypothetical protein
VTSRVETGAKKWEVGKAFEIGDIASTTSSGHGIFIIKRRGDEMKKTWRTTTVLPIIIMIILTGCASMGTISEEEWVDHLQKKEESMMGLGN